MTSAPDHPAASFVEDVRRFGLVSADAVVDRYARLVDRALGDGTTAAAPAPPDPARTAEAVAGLTAAYLRLLDTTASLVDGVADGARTAPLVLPPTDPGSCAEGSIWLHDAASAPDPVELHATSLVAPDGRVLPAAAVSFAPAPGPPAAGAGREIRVRVRVPDDQRCGRYHGLVLASTAPAPLLLVLEVVATAEGPP